MEQKREFTGVWIPAHIIEDKTLSKTEIIIYSEIACFRECYKSNKELGSRWNLSERTVSQAISTLIRKNYIQSNNATGEYRRLQATNSYPSSRKLREPLAENCVSLQQKTATIEYIEKKQENTEESKNKNFSPPPSKTLKNFRNQRRAERGLPPIKSKLSAAQKRSLDELMLLQPDIDLYRSLAEEKGFIYLDQPESANTKIRRQMLAARSRFSEETPDFYQWIFNGNNKWAIKTQYSPESCIVSFMFDAYVNRNVEEKQNKPPVSMSNLYD